jgi:hypothetical protein
LEFDDLTLNSCAPFIEVAGEDYRKRRERSLGPVPMMWLTSQKTIPAVGMLGIWIQDLIGSGKVPVEATGITMADVIDACAKRNSNGIFSLMVKYRSKPKPKPAFGTWLAKNHRHPYSDCGLAVASDGLYVSLLSPKDSREPVMTAKRMKAGRFMDQLDFQCGKKPIRWVIPMGQFLDPGFAETFLVAIKKLHIQLRTLVLDASLMPCLPNEVRWATVRFHQAVQALCADAHVVYDRVPTVGSERTSCRAFLASPESSSATLLDSIMTMGSTECPHCRAEVLLQTDILTGVPINRVETCGNCHVTWQVGLLLAERARIHGAFGWVPEDAYSCS